MKVLVTGGRGLVGARFMESYGSEHELIQLGATHETRVDITDLPALKQALDAAPRADAMIHLAAYTNVNGAFEQTGDKNGAAWQVNVVGTKNIAQVCAERGMYLIHLSTAFVFDGEKTGAYTEDDTPHPIEWYGQTKYESEKMVTTSGAKAVILRIDQPFSFRPSPKVDTLWRVINGLRAGTLFPQFTEHHFGPTVIEELVKVMDFCLRAQPTGIYHASSGESWSDYDFACAVNEILHLGASVKPGDLEAYLRTSARPYQRNTALDVQRLREILDFKLGNVRDAIAKVQLD